MNKLGDIPPNFFPRNVKTASSRPGCTTARAAKASKKRKGGTEAARNAARRGRDNDVRPPTARRANGALFLGRHLRLDAPAPKAAAARRGGGGGGGGGGVPRVPQRLRRHPRQRLRPLARSRRLPLRRPSSWGGVRVRGARRGGKRDLRGGAAAVPRVHLPGGDYGGDDGDDAVGGARAHGGARRRVPRRRVQPRLPQLQPLLRRSLPPPRLRAHPALGQPPRQDRCRLHLRHPGQRQAGAPQGGTRRREGRHPEPLRAPGRGGRRASTATDILPLPLRRRRRQQERDAAAALNLAVADTTRHRFYARVINRRVTAPFLYSLQFCEAWR